MLELHKAHAFGNDFLFATDDQVGERDGAALAREVCDRHTGIGADGLIIYHFTAQGAAMRLFNADGSFSEVSGNGVRCLAALVARNRGLVPSGGTREGTGAGSPVVVETDAGPKFLTLLDIGEGRYTFRASMGAPTELRQLALTVDGTPLTVVALRVGNPQCVVLGPPVTDEGMLRFGPRLEHHEAFPEGTNVEFAEVEAPGRVRILIWERGVGPTLASGTGACAAAVAAAAFGSAARDVRVISPGGTQRVEWREDGLYLTGWAEITASLDWWR
jgi:diaminopimelate epimerase